jgi:hypothetical protein
MFHFWPTSIRAFSLFHVNWTEQQRACQGAQQVKWIWLHFDIKSDWKQLIYSILYTAIPLSRFQNSVADPVPDFWSNPDLAVRDDAKQWCIIKLVLTSNLNSYKHCSRVCKLQARKKGWKAKVNKKGTLYLYCIVVYRLREDKK